MKGPKAERRKKRKSKTCAICKKRKKLESFYKSSSTLDGHGAYCKNCTAVKRKEWIKANKKHCLKLAKEYRDSHKLEIAEYHSEYYSRPEVAKRQAEYQKLYKQLKKKKLAKYNAKYNRENRERLSKKALEYYYNNRERILAMRREKNKKK